jgi:acetyl esterase/lipase
VTLGLIYLIVAAFLGALVLDAWFPARREPMSVLAFAFGWPAGELAVQNAVIEVVVAAVFVSLGALHTAEGWAALAVSAASVAGLIGLAVIAHGARGVMADALSDASGPDLGLHGPDAVPPPSWAMWWRVTRAWPVRPPFVALERHIDYWGDGLDRHRLDVLRPKDPTSNAPVMVYVHGGAWTIGDKREQGRPMLYELVSRGWICVALNYRLSPKGTWPEHIVDVKRALAWVKAHIAEYGGDPGAVAISGGSAGGHLCALAALTANQPEWQPGFEDADTSVMACVPFYGVMDMTGTMPDTGLYGRGLRRLLEQRVMKVPYADHPEVFEQASPTARVHAGAPPFLVLHGVNDTLVPLSMARTFVAALREVSGSPVAYAELPRAQHAFDILASPRCRATTQGVVAFLDAVKSRAAVSDVESDF